MSFDLSAIREAALRATPGTRVVTTEGPGTINAPMWKNTYVTSGDVTVFASNHENADQDAHFIATANPQTVLAMCAEIERLRDIVATLQPVPPPSEKFEVLEIVLKRGSPLHKLWQELHLAKYPENY
jgi:hypothetical protein